MKKLFMYTICFLGTGLSLLASEKTIDCKKFKRLLSEKKVTGCEITQGSKGITKVLATCKLEDGVSEVTVIPPYPRNLEQVVSQEVDSLTVRAAGNFWNNAVTLSLPFIIIGVPILILAILVVSLVVWFMLRQKTEN